MDAITPIPVCQRPIPHTSPHLTPITQPRPCLCRADCAACAQVVASIADNIHEDNLLAYLDSVFWSSNVSVCARAHDGLIGWYYTHESTQHS